MAAKKVKANPRSTPMIIPRYGERSPLVKAMQVSLNNKGVTPKLVTDGIFGPASKRNVSKFQKSKGLPGSGNLGTQTMKLLGLVVEQEQLPQEVIEGIESIGLRILRIGSGELGVKEAKGTADNPRIVLYHRYSTVNNDKGMPDSVAWCSSYECFVHEMAGLDSTNNKMARSWEKWGVAVKVGEGLPGDTVTFYRNGKSSGQGHVATFLKEDKNYVWVMGGNQADEVNVTRYSKANLTGYRRHKTAVYTEAQIVQLKAAAEAILAGKTIATGGSVA